VGGTVFFDSGVRNTGDIDTGVFNIEWFVDGQEVGAYGSHEGVPANTTILDGNSQFSWVATAGTHTIEFVVDVDNHVQESNESNNSRSVTVAVTAQPAKQQFINALSDLQVTFDPITPPFQKSREQLERELAIATTMMNAARQISGITEQRSFQIAVGIFEILIDNTIELACTITGATCPTQTLLVPLCNLPICFLDGDVKFFQASSYQLFSFNVSAQVEKSTLAFIHPGDVLVTDTPFFGIKPSFSIVAVDNTSTSPDFGIVDFKIEGVCIDPEPFTAFNAQAEIEDSEFEIKGSFTLGTASDGINPLTEDVALQVGTFFTMIPPGSFRQDKKGVLKFEGQVDGVELEMVITPYTGNRFDFKSEGTGADLTGTANPVEVKLVVGDDAGMVSVIAELNDDEED
jgi:hypothetical protein